MKTDNIQLKFLLTGSAFHTPLENILNYEEQVAALTNAQIQAAANKYLDENYYSGF